LRTLGIAGPCFRNSKASGLERLIYVETRLSA
jgi:hypothetical protein